MLGLPSIPKAAFIAATLMLSMAATASYADVAQQLSIARSSHTAAASAHAQYPHAVSTNAPSGQCVGGYHWMQRSFNVHRTDNQMMMPMPCH